MKKSIFLFVVIIFSCNISKKTENISKFGKETIQLNESKPTQLSLKKYFGIWVSSCYYDSITKILSPFNSSNCGNRIIDLTISDTCLLIWGYHEGVTLFPDSIFRDTLFLKCLENDIYSLKLKIESDSILHCVNCESDKLVKLSRAANFNNEQNPSYYRGYPDYFRSKYFSGKWEIKDIIEDTTFAIDISKDGRVSGFFNMRKCDVAFDFIGPMPQMDQLYFETINGESISYNFRFNQDTLLLSEILYPKQNDTVINSEIEPDFEGILGKVKYKGIRK